MQDETQIQNLSKEQVDQLLKEFVEKLETESIEDAFQWMQQCLLKHPDNQYLALWLAHIFHSQSQQEGIIDGEQYNSFLLDTYKRVLNSEEDEIKAEAAKALYHFYMGREQYEQAERYLAYLSKEDPEYKQGQAMIYEKTGRREEAFRIYEELLYSGYQSLHTTFNHLYGMALDENDHDKAHMLVDKMGKLANLFEFGEYHEVSPGLELAILEKDEERTLSIAEAMLTNTRSICDFTQSPLYSHMKLKDYDGSMISRIQKDIRMALQEGDIEYLKKNPKWKTLIQSEKEDNDNDDKDS